MFLCFLEWKTVSNKKINIHGSHRKKIWGGDHLFTTFVVFWTTTWTIVLFRVLMTDTWGNVLSSWNSFHPLVMCTTWWYIVSYTGIKSYSYCSISLVLSCLFHIELCFRAGGRVTRTTTTFLTSTFVISPEKATRKFHVWYNAVFGERYTCGLEHTDGWNVYLCVWVQKNGRWHCLCCGTFLLFLFITTMKNNMIEFFNVTCYESLMCLVF